MSFMTDVHMHIIPGIDDGSGSMEESLEEIRMAVAQGVGSIIATPHSWAIKNSHYMMRERFHALREAVREEQIPVTLALGCEVLCDPERVEDCIRKVKEGTFPTLGGTRYVLLEFYALGFSAEDALYCIDQFTAAGYIPVIAHTERYDFTTVENVREMKAHGAKIQINTYSVINETKDRTRSLANALLDEQLVDLVGTDSHKLDHRPPVLEDGITAIRERFTAEYAEKILSGNAEEWLMTNSTKVIRSRIWLDGIMGVIIGDALGCPVQFCSREEVKANPVDRMRGHGTYDMPVGTWTDDGSLTLALLSGIREKKGISLQDIMCRFVAWYTKGEYTPFGEAFDMGRATTEALHRYMRDQDVRTCGGTGANDNGNGSLMRILPACLYAYEQKLDDPEAVRIVHEVSGLTHNHLRAKIACGLHYFCACAILDGTGSLDERLQQGMDRGFAFYKRDINNLTSLSYYGRLKDLTAFAAVPEERIKSSGYVVDSLEASIWSLITTNSFRDCELKAVNLGGDTDTIGAIAGGLAGLYYQYDAIPEDWLAVIQRKDWIEGLCACTE